MAIPRMASKCCLAACVLLAAVHSGSAQTCASGEVQCCAQVQPASSVDFSRVLPPSLLSLLPVNLQGLNVPVGLDCDPIAVLGIGGNTCTQQTVCCENNNFAGLVAIGCTPIDVESGGGSTGSPTSGSGSPTAGSGSTPTDPAPTAATPTGAGQTTCAAGASFRCCATVQPANTLPAAEQAFLPAAVRGTSAVAGLDCEPAGATPTCIEQAVCCEGSGFTSTVAIGCTPATGGSSSGSIPPTAPTPTGPSSTCNSGPVQCCAQVQPASSVDFSKVLPSSLLSLLPINLQGLNVPVGLDCTDIDVLGIGGSTCTQQTVCCENNNFSGLLAIGCTPISI